MPCYISNKIHASLNDLPITKTEDEFSVCGSHLAGWFKFSVGSLADMDTLWARKTRGDHRHRSRGWPWGGGGVPVLENWSTVHARRNESTSQHDQHHPYADWRNECLHGQGHKTICDRRLRPQRRQWAEINWSRFYHNKILCHDRTISFVRSEHGDISVKYWY